MSEKLSDSKLSSRFLYLVVLSHARVLTLKLRFARLRVLLNVEAWEDKEAVTLRGDSDLVEKKEFLHARLSSFPSIKLSSLF